MDVLPVEPALHAAAQARYRASLPSGTSFVDQVSLGVMAQRQGGGPRRSTIRGFSS